MKRFLVFSTFTFLCHTGPAQADNPVTLAKEISSLRVDVETLNDDIDTEKEALKTRLRSLAAQTSDVELELQRQTLMLKQINGQLTDQEESLSQTANQQDLITPEVFASLDSLEASIQQGIPFKRDERLQSVSAIRSQVTKGMIRPGIAMARIWEQIEDELRLTRENGVYKQILEIDGEEVLCEIARLGMVALYFSTPDGRYGKLVSTNTSWTTRVYTGDDNREKVALLFDAFKKQIRVGFFTLPNAFPKELN